jgi:hypothetical protein
VLRARSWRLIPVDLAVVLLFVLCMPALLAVDLFVLIVAFNFTEIWPFHAVRSGYPWLRDKEPRMWGRRRRELRREFLSEEAELLEGGRDPRLACSRVTRQT